MTISGEAGGLLGGRLKAALFRDHHVVHARLDERLVNAVFRVNLPEHERRQRLGLGAVPARALLRMLSAMAPGETADSPALRYASSVIPDGVVEWSPEGVTRLLEPPVALESVVVTTVGPAQTRHVRLADTFAPYARPWVVAADPRVDAATLVMSSVRGTGLVTNAQDEPILVAEAQPAHGWPVPGHSWLLAEEAYDAWLTVQARAEQRAHRGNSAADLVPTP